MSAPTDGAVRSAPRPDRPARRGSSARTPARARSSRRAALRRGRAEIAPSSIRVRRMNPIPAERFFQFSSVAGATATRDVTPRIVTQATRKSDAAVM